ncbi:hypothetical protein YPPY66_0313 [Yersinia pestis PY-66]|uniref:Uncharacterized protein n=1 Tax=Yersinia pestis PY-08 TaxID=992134 RepID=A0AB72ZQN7_YERPE|nr:hypothetical protein YPPY02_0187 [Yersinia pestis PY-02]EIR09734.1 hypothetical protein YPPY05_0197 [Yersinia pestis PY-05]EIR11511.1 hypothetical protein YPPY06_0223 [Yersinia pestis PY-06]EIR25024.1 hypothetical protein YPPY08_0232 [Yersinia pestis PY-08]EIR26927.1 hypothetical protein YPPY09_0243 [Yersinia pestis PY-09]EIR40184.1 hypothetical protein YPPY11_0306 [Yersinia pestis PY-11]EIR53360.1 hypothetical protein YPPY15_0212 [Yersinia pestis PY-15]EIR69237.1 hypothetical protein YPP
MINIHTQCVKNSYWRVTGDAPLLRRTEEANNSGLQQL